MIKIDDRKMEAKVDEVLKRTKYSSPAEYLFARINADYLALKKTGKLLM